MTLTIRSIEHELYSDIFVGDSEMARLMRAHDWSATTLGDPDCRPNALKVALRLLLTSRFEMWLGWGSDIHFFYNDAYRPTLGNKHPQSLGTPTRILWAEIWDDIKDRLATVYEQGQSTWDRALLLVLERNGYREETYHTFSYSPLIGDTGAVEGVFCAVSEETDRVISERRLESLRELASGLAAAQGRTQVVEAVQTGLAHNRSDLPFSIVYLFGEDGAPQMAAHAGIAADHPLTSAECWSLERLSDNNAILVEDAPPGDLPTGNWDRSPSRIAIVPLGAQVGHRPRGALVVGLNPYRPASDQYLSFLDLLGGQIASGLASADALEARTRERDRVRDLFRQAPSFMCIVTGPDHRFELVNNAYLQLVGHRDLIGLSAREALPEIAGQGYFERLDHVYSTGEPYIGRNVPVIVERQPGAAPEERFVHVVYQPIRGEDGRVTGIFVDGYDVTHQKRAEDQLHQLNETLEHRVAERTEELRAALEKLHHEAAERATMERALQQAQKLEALGKLTGGVAHDFNNLLQVISGNLQLLTRDVVGNPRAEKRVENAMAGVTRGAKLASQLLAFGRRQPLEPKVINLGRLVRSMDDLLRRSIGEDVEIETIVAGGLWNTLIDPSQIENAILNLAINARDAMANGGRLTIEASNAFLDEEYCRQHEDVNPGQYVMIAVTDTGSGIPRELIDQVFEPFFSTKPEGKGTGLGLSMVHGLVKQSGGHVKIYSEVDEGTTIRLYLPRSAEDEDIVTEISAGPARGGSETVLVVEDDDEVRETTVALLTELGYRVLKSRDALSALSVVDSGIPIDLLFTDVVMPGPLRSPELARKAKERLPEIAVLFTSGYTENAIVHHGRLDPGVELLSKPYTREALARKVRHVLGSRTAP
ncbi:ATP-binding protein [uncultured Sphingomonas sp.]|uniref:ATP-binding protein n=1 Tax=uncultured Sphingomonas sp. TaxID=158754 RepID=UPI0025D8D9F1|nr:ATP-binding protein [uncultured Sphingomonas sp.]